MKNPKEKCYFAANFNMELEMADSKIAGVALFFIPVGALAFCDQLTKYLIACEIPLNTGINVIPGFFNLIHVHNTGGAFSVFAGPGDPFRRYIFMAVAVAVVAAIAYAYSKTGRKDYWTRTSYVCIAGGAVGNLIDRVRLGEVIDFLDLYAGRYHWPAFNVADAAISTGAVMLLVSLIKERK
jgi:signal peptidase II